MAGASETMGLISLPFARILAPKIAAETMVRGLKMIGEA